MNLCFSFFEKADFQSHRTNNKKLSGLCRGTQTGATVTVIYFWYFRFEIVRPILEYTYLPYNSINFQNMSEIRFQDNNYSKRHEHALI